MLTLNKITGVDQHYALWDTQGRLRPRKSTSLYKCEPIMFCVPH